MTETTTLLDLTMRMFVVMMATTAIVRPNLLADHDERPYSVRQITTGHQHHLFGYIGHALTVPWNQSGRFILALRTTFDDHLPQLGDSADVVVLDAHDEYRAIKLDTTRAWNFQQGTMFYWNPQAPESQFFFNDRDPDTGEVFTVLGAIDPDGRGRRLKEYRYRGTGVGNSGVAPSGGQFLALNYGRLARLRKVTGYLGADDWSRDQRAPADDGVFLIDVPSGERRLLVSYAQLRDALSAEMPFVERCELFINHTLWNRPSNRIYFFVRANFGKRGERIDTPFTVNVDGSGLARHRYLGGHPEWADGFTMALSDGSDQVLYDTVDKRIVKTIGPAGTFPDPGADVALSPDGAWLVNGHTIRGGPDEGSSTVFTFLHRKTEQVIQTERFPVGSWPSRALRVDPAPGWNRDSDQILFGALDPTTNTRQLFVLTLDDPTPD